MAPPKVPEENTDKIVPDNQLAMFAINAGFPKDKIAMMVAIAIAESGADATAVGRGVPSRPDYGLWQINYIHKEILRPDFFPPGKGWMSPIYNAEAAKKIYDMQGLAAWTVYKSGAYLRFKTRGDKAAANPATGITAPPEHSGENAIKTVTPFESEWWEAGFGKQLRQSLWIGGGAILVVLGFILYFKAQISPAKIAKAVVK